MTPILEALDRLRDAGRLDGRWYAHAYDRVTVGDIDEVDAAATNGVLLGVLRVVTNDARLHVRWSYVDDRWTVFPDRGLPLGQGSAERDALVAALLAVGS